MSGKIGDQLKALGLSLPPVAAPKGNYVPWLMEQGLVYISGQLPISGSTVAYKGQVGQDLTLEEGQAAARLCALHLIAQLEAACGNLERLRQVVRLGGYVNAAADFVGHPQVLNGASDLMVDIFGKAGRHTRSAIGVASLPLDAAVEIDAIFAIS